MIRIFTDLPEPLISLNFYHDWSYNWSVFSWVVTKKSTDKTIKFKNG